ncbi:hypothetical protein MPTK1_4g17690 [Marchantia polymorpha subsp. ruderalis]|uniref:Uncharacterized protein n=2 Tax=Marchantia polymorpha TaxID=3197 RepID=A0AAF6BAX9_MARPO|nr:hypothetical protein MARPO_0041s0051 [Marchantia polymorpha]BBN09163.1 hypothetical protein Mp_4g17690 [Marchantia polymorpha subsp. ruderalis]|eukprot:PTQ40151.1 hypothetical protein MARPO_0041s0051 [Marchantia polymorpha]
MRHFGLSLHSLNSHLETLETLGTLRSSRWCKQWRNRLYCKIFFGVIRGALQVHNPDNRDSTILLLQEQAFPTPCLLLATIGTSTQTTAIQPPLAKTGELIQRK